MRIDVETVLDLNEKRKAINSIPLENIEWFENGKLLQVREGAVEEFKFTGLANIDFILCGYYKPPV